MTPELERVFGLMAIAVSLIGVAGVILTTCGALYVLYVAWP